MRKKLKKLLALAICLVVATSFATNIPGLQNVSLIKADDDEDYDKQVVPHNGINWTFYGKAYSNNVFEVKKITATLSNTTNDIITIPDSIRYNGIEYKITCIPEGLFKNNTYVTEVILGNNITEIKSSAFSNCPNLLSISTKNAEQVVSVSHSAFQNCKSLETVDMTLGDIWYYSFSGCDSLKEINNFKGKCIGLFCFQNSGIEKFNFLNAQDSLEIQNGAFSYSKLRNVEIPCNVSLGGSVFSHCPKLSTVEFNGYVNTTSNRSSLFDSSFSQEYDENGKLIPKTVTFHNSVNLHDFQSPEAGDFMNCTGLSKIIFEKTAFIPTGTFYNCPELTDIVFESDAYLGEAVFAKLDKLNKTITFKGIVSGYSYTSNPFSNSTIENVIFNPTYNGGFYKQYVNCNFGPGVKRIEFGPYVTEINGTIQEDATLDKIIFGNTITPKLKDEQKTSHNVYGYGSFSSEYNKIDEWCRSNGYATFKNFVSNLKIKDTLKFYGSVNKTEIDFSQLKVQYNFEIDDEINEVKTTSYSPDGKDYNGYVVNTIDIDKEELTPGIYNYLVKYAGASVWGEIVVEDIVPTKMEVDWDEDSINNLVAGQDLSLQDVVSGVAITYNNGDKKTFGKNQLDNMSITSGSSISLVNKNTEKGSNTFKVVYKETSKYVENKVYNLETSDKFFIKENYITKISATVAEKERYVGDTVSIDDFEVLATYKYNEDPTVEHKLKPTSVENTVLTVSGSNIVKVNYNTFSESVTVSAIEVCPAKIVAAFNKNNAYIDGQTKYDLDAFNVAVTYNNGDSKDNYEQKNLSLTEDNCVVEELLRTGSEATVILKYTENGVTVESQEIVVPITEKKPTSINVVSNMDSMVEGSEFDKSNITSIEITYNNGNTEVQDSSLIDYENLSISHDAIVANQKNTITVTYLGVKTTIDVEGTAKTVNRIEAVYVGEPVAVGNYFDAADVEFTLYYNNGQSEVISSGFIVKDADRQVVKAGPNEVYVYYDAMYTTITVPGIASDIIPTNTLTPVPTSTSDSGISPTELPLANNEQTMAPAATTTAPTTTETTAPVATTTAPAAATTAPVAATNIATNNIPGALSTSFNIISNHKLIKLSGDLNSKVYTNKKIEITIDATNANNIQYQIITGKNALSENGWKNVSGSKITVNKSNKASVIYFRYKDANGNTVNTHTCYFTIDKQKAKINVKNGKTYKTGFKLKFSDASGIDYAKLDGKNTKNNTKITKKGLHKIIVLDKAGNKKIVKFKVK